MADLRKLLDEALRDQPYTMSYEHGTMFVRTVCCRSDATLRLQDLAPQLAAALIKAREGLRRLEYWFDVDQEILDGMTPRDVEDNDHQLSQIRATLAEIDALMGDGE